LSERLGRTRVDLGCSGNFACITRERPVIPRQILRECGEANTYSLTFTPKVDKRQCEKGTNGAIKLVRGGMKLGKK
jgi:hypothetical protein